MSLWMMLATTLQEEILPLLFPQDQAISQGSHTLFCTMKDSVSPEESAPSSTTVESQLYSNFKEFIVKTGTANLYCSTSVCGFVCLFKKKKSA